jgi:uncharacterized membrane protein
MSQLVLVAAKYADLDRANTIVEMLGKMRDAGNIELADAATVTKGADGKLQIGETRELTGKQGAKKGAIAAGIAAVIFPPSIIASAVVGGAAGAAWGKLRDTGIKSKSMEELGEKLEAGSAAVMALTAQESVAAVEKAMQGYDGQLLTHEFTAAESANIEAAASSDSGTTPAA